MNCQSQRLVSGQRCTLPPAGLFRAGCVHEHVEDAWLCGTHADAGNVQCAACWVAGHDCELLIIPRGEDALERQA